MQADLFVNCHFRRWRVKSIALRAGENQIRHKIAFVRKLRLMQIAEAIVNLSEVSLKQGHKQQTRTVWSREPI